MWCSFGSCARSVGNEVSVGGLTNRPAQALVPSDMRGTRQNQIGLLNYLLGFGNAPGAASTPAGPHAPFSGQGQPGPQGNAYLGGQVNPLDRLQNFFGQLGMPTSDLQRQTSTGISQFLNQPAPEQRALDIASPGLQEILQGGGPQFERDLSLANQQGGRFGSANAVLRGEAMRNLYNQRDQAAQTLGMLSSSAGQNPFARLTQGYGVGQQQAQQGDVETQRRLQLLMQLLGVGQQTAFNLPITQGQSPLDALGQLGAIVSQFIPGHGGGGAAGTQGANSAPASGGWNPQFPV